MRVDSQTLIIPLVDDRLERFGDIRGKEPSHGFKVALFKRHKDHFICAASTLEEGADHKPGFGHLHGCQCLSAVRTIIDVIDNVMIRSTLDHIKLWTLGNPRLRRSGHWRLFKPVACTQNASKAKDQEQGNSGKNQKLYQRRAHHTSQTTGRLVWSYQGTYVGCGVL